MPKYVHLSSVHPPFDTRIFVKECQTLRDDGFTVSLIVPYHQDGLVASIALRAIAKPTSRWKRFTRTIPQLFRRALAERADVYHFHDPELIPVGLLLKLWGARVVYDVHEDVPRQILIKNWIPRWGRKPISWLVELVERVSTLFFDGIVAATPTIANRFPARKTLTVQNYPLLEEFLDQHASPTGERAPIVAYVGAINVERGIREMVKAIGQVPAQWNARLVLAGEFSENDDTDELLQSPGWQSVDLLGWSSRQEVTRLLSRARVGLVTLHPTETYVVSNPVKLYEYMAAGVPVVASDFPMWREIVTTADCGLLVDPLNPSAIADAITWLLAHPQEAGAMGQRGRTAVLERFNWQPEGERLVEFARALAGSSTCALSDTPTASEMLPAA